MMSGLKAFKRALVLAPHTDDGEFGAGGTISRLVEDGVEVFYLAFSAAEESVPEGLDRDVLRKEVLSATYELGIPEASVKVLDYRVRKFHASRQEILEDLVKIRKEFSPDLVLTPSRGDVHQDHHVVAEESVRAFKKQTVLSYELVWNNLAFASSALIRLESRHVDAKISALSKYASQAGRAYSSPEFIRSMACVRGIQIDSPWAEAFEVVRWCIH